MPATILIAETIIRKSRQHLRLANWSVLARFVMITNQPIGQREVEPVCAVAISIKGNAVWIMQTAKILCDFFEAQCSWIKLVQNVDHAATIVRAVVHVRDEDPLIGTERHEANSFESLHGDADFVALGQIECKRFPVGEGDLVRNKFWSGGDWLDETCEQRQERNTGD